jgi:hypothetical protein
VGIHPPTEIGNRQDANAAAALKLLERQTKPAVMELEVVEEDDEMSMFVSLHRADALTGIMEVDRSGRICKAGSSPIYQAGMLLVYVHDWIELW